MSDYDSGADLFIMQSIFREIEDDVNTQVAVDAVDSLLASGESDLLDFSNQKDNSSVLPDEVEDEFSGNFPEVS